MKIRDEDIEPKTRKRLQSAMEASWANPTPSPAELHARQLTQRHLNHTQTKPFLLYFTGLLGALMVGAIGIMNVMASPAGFEWGWGAMSASTFILGIILGVRFLRWAKSDLVHIELLTAWLPLLDLTPAERVYGETIALLAATNTNLDEATQRDLLSQLNTLMTQYRHLDEQREAVLRVAGVDTLASLDTEQARLAHLLAETGDAQARETLQASLNLCQSRLTNARALTQTRERLDAQQELLLQTFASIRDSLTRNKAASVPLSLPDVEEIHRNVREINIHAASVETAVQEVLTLQTRT
jgi:hypothetical protein